MAARLGLPGALALAGDDLEVGLMPRSPWARGGSRSLVQMGAEDQSATPLLDEWMAEVGEEQVAATMRAVADEVRTGVARDMIDQDAHAAYRARRRQRSAS